MTDHVAGPNAPASSPSRVAELHQLARQDYTKGQQERASVPNLLPTYAAGVHAPEPSDLDVAIRVGRFEMTEHDRYRVEKAREELTAAESLNLLDERAMARTIGRLEVALMQLVEMVDEAVTPHE